jgi:processive 1,2-diacylglycerol beta-glucosyltransferase
MEKKYPSGHKKVLIMYAPLGAGHKAAADAITEAFALKYPNIEVKNIDVLDFVFEIFKQGLPWAFVFINSNTPVLYKWFYEYYNSPARYKALNNASNTILKKSRFVKFIEKFAPDFIISTNPLPMQLVSKTKEENIINIPSANVCTDFGFHSFWHNKDVNYYFVANEDIKKVLGEYNVESEKIQVIGIPTSSKFSKIIDKKVIINKLGFEATKPILLIVGGRTSYKNLFKIITGIKKENKTLQIIIVAGRDKILYKNLKDSKIDKDLSIKIFGFISNLEEYMTVADLILTKAGGLTVSECLVKNLPMVINDIIPGQEEDNVNYAEKNGFGIKADSAKEAIKAINELFLQPERLIIMRENCKKIAKPSAAEDLVDFIASKL